MALPPDTRVVGSSGHVADHNAIVDVISQGVTAVSVKSFGAKGDAVTNDTTAVQNALSSGQHIYFPDGRYMVDPGVLTVPVSRNGQRLVGSGPWKARLVRRSNGLLLDASGSATGDANHLKYLQIDHLGLDGGGFTGTLLRSYYSGDNTYDSVLFFNTVGSAFDGVEFWDSRIVNCRSESCGDSANGYPVWWWRNSAATVGNFGYSTDNCNSIMFTQNRTEVFRGTAIQIEQGVGATGVPNTFFLYANKIEGDANSGDTSDTPYLLVGTGVVQCVVDKLQLYANRNASFTNLIRWSGGLNGALKNVIVGTGTNVTGLTQGVLMNATDTTEVSNVKGQYLGPVAGPSSGHIVYTGPGPFYRPVANTTTAGTAEVGITPAVFYPPPGVPTVKNITADTTLIIADAYRKIESTSATAVNITIPPHSSVAYPVETTFDIWQIGAGPVTLVAGAGVSIHGTLTIPAQYTRLRLRQRATDDWVSEGVPAPASITGTMLAPSALQLTANRQTASYTLVLSDAGKVVEMNVAGANTLTVPPNSSVAFPVGTLIEVNQYGAGQTTITAGGGVTIRSANAKVAVAAQYVTVGLRKVATDEWMLVGSLA